MLLQPGTTLGPYEILSPIGAGGMGEEVGGNRTNAIYVFALPEEAGRR